MELWLTKDLAGRLVANDDTTREVLRKLKVNQPVQVSIRQPRNGAHHNKFFAMLNLVFNNQERYQTLEHLLTAVKLEAGHYEEFVTLEGELVLVSKSIAFHRMDQMEFDQFYTKAVAGCIRLLPGMSAEQLEQAVMEFAA